MRKKERIAPFLKVIEQIWELQPDTRFNQLVHNLKMDFYNKKGLGTPKKTYAYNELLHEYEQTGTYIDLYHVEDEVFFEFLEDTLRLLQDPEERERLRMQRIEAYREDYGSMGKVVRAVLEGANPMHERNVVKDYKDLKKIIDDKND